MFARVGFVDDLSFQQDGIFGRESRCGMYRMLDPALYGFVHIDQVSKKVTSPYIRIPKMSALYHTSPRRSHTFCVPVTRIFIYARLTVSNRSCLQQL